MNADASAAGVERADAVGRLVEARATVSMRKLPAGRVALVDPDHPFVALCFKRGLLVCLSAWPSGIEKAT